MNIRYVGLLFALLFMMAMVYGFSKGTKLNEAARVAHNHYFSQLVPHTLDAVKPDFTGPPMEEKTYPNLLLEKDHTYVISPKHGVEEEVYGPPKSTDGEMK